MLFEDLLQVIAHAINVAERQSHMTWRPAYGTFCLANPIGRAQASGGTTAQVGTRDVEQHTPNITVAIDGNKLKRLVACIPGAEHILGINRAPKSHPRKAEAMLRLSVSPPVRGSGSATERCRRLQHHAQPLISNCALELQERGLARWKSRAVACSGNRVTHLQGLSFALDEASQRMRALINPVDVAAKTFCISSRWLGIARLWRRVSSRGAALVVRAVLVLVREDLSVRSSPRGVVARWLDKLVVSFGVRQKCRRYPHMP